MIKTKLLNLFLIKQKEVKNVFQNKPKAMRITEPDEKVDFNTLFLNREPIKGKPKVINY